MVLICYAELQPWNHPQVEGDVALQSCSDLHIPSLSCVLTHSDQTHKYKQAKNLMKHRNNPKLDARSSFCYHAFISLYLCILFTFARETADIRTGLKWTCFVTRCVTYWSTSKSGLHTGFQSRNVCPATCLKLC